MTDRDHEQSFPRPKGTRIIVYIMMMLVFGAVYFVLLGQDSSEEQIKCDPDTDFTCKDPSELIIRFIANYHFMLWHISYHG